MSKDVVLSVKKLVKSYPNFTLKDISFELFEGTITGFIGKNGAGKSTTLKAILGLIKMDSGNINFNIDKIGNAHSIGYLGMEKGIYEEERLKHIAKFVANAWKGCWNETEYRYYAEEVFGLNVNQKMKELSTGMVIKFLISLELAKNPKLLLLDEPTSGLDPVVRKEILGILKKLVTQKKVTVLFSSHITDDIMKIADKVIFINKGSIVLQDSKEAIKNRYVKMKQEDVNKLPKDICAAICSNGVLNDEYYVWDNKELDVTNSQICTADFDDVLIALSGSECNADLK